MSERLLGRLRCMCIEKPFPRSLASQHREQPLVGAVFYVESMRRVGGEKSIHVLCARLVYKRQRAGFSFPFTVAGYTLNGLYCSVKRFEFWGIESDVPLR